jgi:hypothetical protein
MRHVKFLIDGHKIAQVPETEGRIFTEVIILLFLVHTFVMLVVETLLFLLPSLISNKYSNICVPMRMLPIASWILVIEFGCSVKLILVSYEKLFIL